MRACSRVLWLGRSKCKW